MTLTSVSLWCQTLLDSFQELVYRLCWTLYERCMFIALFPVLIQQPVYLSNKFADQSTLYLRSERELVFV